MILIDSLYINNGGGKILLDYLVKEIEKKNINVFYVFDERVKNDYKQIPLERKVYLKATICNRKKFYKKNKGKFIKVLCFANLPSLINLDCVSYTYFHQPMYLNIPKEFNYIERLKFRIKQQFLYFYKKNTSYWLVQNSLIQQNLCKKYNIHKDKVLITPFYPNEDLIKDSEIRENNVFIYVSNATAHKNHLRLFEAFKLFYNKYKTGKLIVTVSDQFPLVLDHINGLIYDGYPIENIGFVDREELITNYHKSEYLIFPSLEESFGLGIVEAIECGCKVIGADLPYMFQVCEPSLSFNPFDIDDIENAFVKAFKKEEVQTRQKLFNEINSLISLLIQ
nr:glycosyltransferase [uncultured Flavobacterium sp.]